MFYPLSLEQRLVFRRDAKVGLFQAFVLGPALMLAVAGVIGWAESLNGMGGSHLSRTFLGDSFTLLAFIQAYLVVLMAFPALLCALSDPVESRLAMWALSASVFSLLPHVFCVMETLGARLGVPSLAVVPAGLHYTVGARPSIPELRFTPGTSPQIE